MALGLVAKQLAVAEVAVFIRDAVAVGRAGTGHGAGFALAAHAVVAGRAHFTVFTSGLVGGVGGLALAGRCVTARYHTRIVRCLALDHRCRVGLAAVGRAGLVTKWLAVAEVGVIWAVGGLLALAQVVVGDFAATTLAFALGAGVAVVTRTAVFGVLAAQLNTRLIGNLGAIAQAIGAATA